MNRFPSLLALVAVLGMGAAHAQWQLRASPEPIVRAIQPFASTPAPGSTTLWAGTMGAGFFTAVDDGVNPVTWQRRNNGLPTLRIYSFFSVSTSTAYAATDGFGVYKTTDGGGSWQPVNGSGPGALGCHKVRVINRIVTGSPATTTLYAGTHCRSRSGVYKSLDDGATWVRLTSAPPIVDAIPEDIEIQGVAFNSDGTMVRVNARDHGVYLSFDSGVTFTQRNNGLPPNPTVYGIQCSTFCNGAQSVLLAYVEGAGIYKSVDLGLNWVASNSGLPAGGNSLSSISRSSLTAPPTFFIGMEKQGIFRSTDEGATWTVLGNTATVEEVAFPRGVNQVGTNLYYVATLDGVKKSTDGGLSWSPLDMGHGRVNTIAHDPVTPSLAYITGATIYKLPNIYATDFSGAGPADSGINGTVSDGEVVAHPTSSGTLFAATNHKGLFKTTNGGASWSPINSGLPSMVGQDGRIAIELSNPATMYAAFRAGAGVYRSDDGGATWTVKNSGLATSASREVMRVEIDNNAPATLYAAATDGVYKSINRGDSWSKVFEALDATGVAWGASSVRVNPASGNDVYITVPYTNTDGTPMAGTGLLRSTDGGATWDNKMPGRRAVAVRPLLTGGVFVGVDDVPGQPAVYRGINGSSFNPYAGGLQSSDIQALGVDAARIRVLSAGMADGFYTLYAGQNDFNADAHPDIIWSNTANGATYLWRMGGQPPALLSDAFITQIDPSWKIQGIADLNGDGHPDLVWRNTATGNTYVWYMNEAGFISDAFLFALPPEWVIQGVADFNADGKPDFLMRNTVSGNAFVWFFNDNVPIGDQFLFNIDPSWKVEAVADLSSDGQPDLLFRNMSSGLAFAWATQWSAGSLSLGPSSAPIFGIDPVWEIVQMEDWNGDGFPDLLFRNRDTGLVFVWYMVGVTLQGSDFVTQIDPSWEIVPRR